MELPAELIETVKRAIAESETLIGNPRDERRRGIRYYTSVGIDYFGIPDHDVVLNDVIEAAAKAVLTAIRSQP